MNTSVKKKKLLLQIVTLWIWSLVFWYSVCGIIHFLMNTSKCIQKEHPALWKMGLCFWTVKFAVSRRIQVTRNSIFNYFYLLNVLMSDTWSCADSLSVGAAHEGQHALALRTQCMFISPSLCLTSLLPSSDEHNSPCTPRACLRCFTCRTWRPRDVTLNAAACFVGEKGGRVSMRFLVNIEFGEQVIGLCLRLPVPTHFACLLACFFASSKQINSGPGVIHWSDSGRWLFWKCVNTVIYSGSAPSVLSA